MNARLHYRCDAEAETLDEMVGSTDYIDSWLSDIPCPSSVAGLLAFAMTRDTSSDEFADAVQRVRDDFERWAHRPSRFATSPVAEWIEQSREMRL